MNHRRALSFLAIGTLGAMLGGCASVSEPRLSVAEARATERSEDGAAMVFVIDAKNENDDALPLRTVEYALDLDGRRVFEGTRSAEATLRRRGEQQFSLPAVVKLRDEASAGIGQGVSRYRLTGEVYYITPGQFAEVLFDTGVRRTSAVFAFEGEIDLSGGKFIPTAAPAAAAPIPAATATSAPADPDPRR